MRIFMLLVLVLSLSIACDDSCDCCDNCPGSEAPEDSVPAPLDTAEALPDTALDTTPDLVPDAGLCPGSETFCACMNDKNGDEAYTAYCNCIDSPSVPGGDNETYCGCCFFAYDEAFPEYDEQWKFLAVGTCDPQGFEPPCQFD